MNYVIIAFCVAAIELGWVLSVRLVAAQSVYGIVLLAMAMHGLSGLTTLILVDDLRSIFPAMMGGGLGAMLGMLVPPIGVEAKSAPRGKIVGFKLPKHP